MGIAATRMFEFLAQAEDGVIERYEVASTEFGDLRSSIWTMSSKLVETDDDQDFDASGKLRVLLSEWLTVPIPFRLEISEYLQEVLGSPKNAGFRWGTDFKFLYDQAISAINTLKENQSPLRKVLFDVTEQVEKSGQSIRIYCHRRARCHFESLFPGLPLLNESFLHSVRDYRESSLFDVLIKVGPLRPLGWGAVPDAILTAPRYSKLCNIVWTGCINSPDFGYDPTVTASQVILNDDSSSSTVTPGENSPYRWKTVTSQHGTDSREGLRSGVPPDELARVSRRSHAEDTRPATLVQVDDDHGILLPPNANVPTVDPRSRAGLSIASRSVADEFEEGMFVVLYDRLDFDLGELHADPGTHSAIWRERLIQEWQRSPEELLTHLNDAGLDLLRPDLAIKNWIKPPDTVIHAPGRPDHFEILLQVLGFDREDLTKTDERQSGFIELAWKEVHASRGVAIQSGFQEHEIVEEQLLKYLKDLTDSIMQHTSENHSFHLRIPVSSGISGNFRFYRIEGLEFGFHAPSSELRVLNELSTIDQWRD